MWARNGRRGVLWKEIYRLDSRDGSARVVGGSNVGWVRGTYRDIILRKWCRLGTGISLLMWRASSVEIRSSWQFPYFARIIKQHHTLSHPFTCPSSFHNRWMHLVLEIWPEGFVPCAHTYAASRAWFGCHTAQFPVPSMNILAPEHLRRHPMRRSSIFRKPTRTKQKPAGPSEPPIPSHVSALALYI